MRYLDCKTGARIGLSSAGILAATLSLMGCGKSTGAADPDPSAFSFKVQVVAAQPKPVEDASEFVATVKSRASVTLQPQVEGQITRIFVKSGDLVGEGKPILQIDPLKQAATVNSQEATRKSRVANLELAEIQLQRLKQLYSSGVASKQDLDQAQMAYDTAKSDVSALDAQVREQQVQLKYFSVVSPLEGIVGDIPVHVGDRVTTSTILTTVDRKTGLEAYINVPADRAPQVRLGLPVQVLGTDGGILADCRVTFISPQVDTNTQSVLIKAAILQPHGLRADQFVRTRVIWSKKSALVVPVTSVTRVTGQYFVFVAEAGEKGGLVARQKPVHVGSIVGNDYVLLDGVQAGEKLIVSGTQNLADGTPVSVGQ
jgi:RND family efflux transporter MFP subunit